MIYVHDKNSEDFSTNGLGAIDPYECVVSESLNGKWEVKLSHIIDDDGKWARLAPGNVMIVPVPAATTPALTTIATQGTSIDVYEVQTSGLRLNLRSGPSLSAKIIRAYSPGTEVVSLGVSGDWREVTAPDGAHGYMWASNTVFVRTETTPGTAEETVVESTTLRAQPFRIYRRVPSLNSITVYARHIFYDWQNNYVKSLSVADATGAAALSALSGACEEAHPFQMLSDVGGSASGEWANKNPIDIMLGDPGIASTWGGELARDWYDVYLVDRVGADRDTEIRQGKNIVDVTPDENDETVITRIVPVGEDADGKPLYLPELYVDSEYIDSYSGPRWGSLVVSDAKEVASGDDARTKSECYEIMRAAAAKEFENGCDLTAYTLSVDFVQASDLEEYADIAVLEKMHIGDGVRVIVPRLSVAVVIRVTDYEYDAIAERYSRMTLGTIEKSLTQIAAAQLPQGIVTGTKIAPGAIGGLQIANGAVNSLQIALAAIQYAHIGQATIDDLNASAITALTAKINEIVAGIITTDQLYAAYAEITALIVGNITAGTIVTNSISAALGDFIRLFAQYGDFDFANVQNLIADAMIIRQGVGGSVYIDNLAATSAQFVSATLGELVVKGTDGHYYKIIVQSDGTIGTEQVTPTAGEISDGEMIDGRQIVESTVNVVELNAQTVKASSAIISTIFTAALTAGKITAGEAMIASATIPQLYASVIQSISDGVSDTSSFISLLNNQVAIGVGAIQVGVTNHATGTNTEATIATWTGAVNQNYVPGWIVEVVPTWQVGDVITVSCYYEITGVAWSGGACSIYIHGPGNVTAWSPQINVNVGPANAHIMYANAAASGSGVNASGRVTYQIALTAEWLTNDYFTIYIRSDYVTAGTVRAWHFQAEHGNKATDWSPHPEEFQTQAGLVLTRKNANITAEESVSMEILNSDGSGSLVGQFNADGLYVPGIINSPSVASAYCGPTTLYIDPSATEAQLAAGTHFKSIAAALAELNYRFYIGDVTVNLAQGITCYENLAVRGLMGYGIITFMTQGAPAAANYAKAHGELIGNTCAVKVVFDRLKIEAPFTSGINSLAGFYRATSVQVSNCILTGNAYTLNMAQAVDGTTVYFNDCEIYNTGATSDMRGLYAGVGGEIFAKNNKGSLGAGIVHLANMGKIVADGTRPATTGDAKDEWGNGTVLDTGVTADSGSAPSAPVVPTTYTYSTILTRSRSSVYGWYGDTDTSIRQGYTTGSHTFRGIIWFNNTTLRSQLSGKTIKAATLRLAAMEFGSSPARLIGLIGVTNTEPSGGITGQTATYWLDSLAFGEIKELSIPVAVVEALRDGTINAIGIYTGETETLADRPYSYRYRVCEGSGSDYPPLLTVVTE